MDWDLQTWGWLSMWIASYNLQVYPTFMSCAWIWVGYYINVGDTSTKHVGFVVVTISVDKLLVWESEEAGAVLVMGVQIG